MILAQLVQAESEMRFVIDEVRLEIDFVAVPQ